MRVSTDRAIDYSNYSVNQIDRATISSLISANWVGRQNSTFTIQYLRFKDGKIAATGDFQGNEILSITFPGVCAVRVMTSGDYQIDLNPGVEITGPERIKIGDIATTEWKSRPAHVTRHAQFYAQQPWTKLNGMTPSQAVTFLQALGW